MVLAMVPAAAPTEKKAPGHFLPRADFDDGAVLVFVEIDLERFLVGGERVVARVHGIPLGPGRQSCSLAGSALPLR